MVTFQHPGASIGGIVNCIRLWDMYDARGQRSLRPLVQETYYSNFIKCFKNLACYFFWKTVFCSCACRIRTNVRQRACGGELKVVVCCGHDSTSKLNETLAGRWPFVQLKVIRVDLRHYENRCWLQESQQPERWRVVQKAFSKLLIQDCYSTSPAGFFGRKNRKHFLIHYDWLPAIMGKATLLTSPLLPPPIWGLLSYHIPLKG